jgi:hypothetical protein
MEEGSSGSARLREGALGPPKPPQRQMGLFVPPSPETPITDLLQDIAVEQLRPVDALVLLSELVEMARSLKSGGLA